MPTPTFEYQIVETHDETAFIGRLGTLSADGWEVAGFSISTSLDGPMYVALVKRPASTEGPTVGTRKLAGI